MSTISPDVDLRSSTNTNDSRLVLTDSQLQDLKRISIDEEDILECFPCAPIEEEILFSQTSHGGWYQRRIVWEISPSPSSTEPLDLDRLRIAWQALAEIHPMLRTIYVHNHTLASTYAIQVVLRHSAPLAPVVQCATVSDVNAVRLDESLPAGMPQMTLCQIHETGATMVVLHLNHTLVDAMSLSVLRRDLARLYDGPVVQGPQSAYADYVSHLEQEPVGESGLKFWASYVAGLEPCFFPSLNPAPSLTSSPSSTACLGCVKVDLGALSRYDRFSMTTGVTAASACKLAWGLVLRAYTGSNSVCFGYMTAGRDLPVAKIKNTVGPLVNQLVCRVDLDVTRSLLELAQTVQSEFTQALPYQHVSLADIAHDLHLAGDPLFNTSMTFPPPSRDSDADQTAICITEIDRGDPTEHDIVVEVGVQGSAMHAMLKYRPSFLSNDQAVDVARTFSTVLAQIIDRPEELAGRVQLLSPEDELRIAHWNRRTPVRVEYCVQDLILRQCQQQPHAVAVDAWDGQITYRELDDWSTSLSWSLQAAGLGSGDFVAVCFSTSRWTHIAVLGAIKAGAAFLLLDPSYPREGLHEMCQTLRPKMIICSPEHQRLAAELNPHRFVVWPDEERYSWSGASPPADQPGNNPPSPSDALYVVFTSGSTGKPKGAVVEHHSFCAMALESKEILLLSPSSRVFQFSPYVFDTSIFDILVPLIAGGCVCVPTEFDRSNHLARTMDEMQVNWAITVPPIARMLRPEQVPTLGTLCLIGEAMTPSDRDLWANAVHLMNTYGPTECAVMATIQPRMAVDDSDPVNIGVPIAAACTWVVDPSDSDQLVPVGAVGELVIEGSIVGRGYLDQTVHPSPFLSRPSWIDRFRPSSHDVRLYRTGDLVQYTPDGSLRFRGRKDHQVQLRGQRVELGEIEARTRHTWPGDCEVIIVERVTPPWAKSEPMLVAFIQLENTSGDSNSNDVLGPPPVGFKEQVCQATSRLERLLPSPLVPKRFFPLLRIPLGRTGKTDRRLLRHLVAELPPPEQDPDILQD